MVTMMLQCYFSSNLALLTKTGFKKPSLDVFNHEDIKKNGTSSVEISLTCLLAGESFVIFIIEP